MMTDVRTQELLGTGTSMVYYHGVYCRFFRICSRFNHRTKRCKGVCNAGCKIYRDHESQIRNWRSGLSGVEK